MSRTTASLVCYRSHLPDIEPLLQSLGEDPCVAAWVVVDNSAAMDPGPAADLRNLVQRYGGIYVAAPRNVGFGAGHNLALKVLREYPSEFHVMLNPDLSFDARVLQALAALMDERPSVGLVMPRVRYPDGVTQSHCHLLPTPLDLGLRRFAPLAIQRLARRKMERYALQGMDRSQPAQVPFFSGCFMFTRRSVLESVGGFDERYFLYMEDVDLCRRLIQISQLLYWPATTIVHAHQRGSYKDLKLMLLHARSAILYFNKWGWIFDAARSRINRETLLRLPQREQSRQLIDPLVDQP